MAQITGDLSLPEVTCNEPITADIVAQKVTAA
jgi:hypothetical protein